MDLGGLLKLIFYFIITLLRRKCIEHIDVYNLAYLETWFIIDDVILIVINIKRITFIYVRHTKPTIGKNQPTAD